VNTTNSTIVVVVRGEYSEYKIQFDNIDNMINNTFVPKNCWNHGQDIS